MATMYEKMMERLVDRVADQAVEIAKLKQEAEHLKKEMAYHDDLHQQVRDDLDQVREERDCLVKDLRFRQVEARQGRERLEAYEQLAESVAALVYDRESGDYDTGFVAACKKQAQELIKIEPLEPARAS